MMQTVSEYEYSQANLIGHGAFALVFQGRRKQTHVPVAIKQIALKSVPGKLSNIRQKEITILKDLTHPNIVRLYDYVETKSDIFLIMEYCNGGDMGDYLQSKKTLSDNSIRHLARHISGALKAIHELEIIHRDIKPQNLLLSFSNSRKDFRDATIKLADFGFARYLTGTDLAATLCGSPLYMAPEILLGVRYDGRADLWSVGTILFQCHSGYAPFLAPNPHALRKKYEKDTLIPKIPEGTSPYLTDLLIKLLKKNPKERLSHDGLFSHPFLRDPTPQVTEGHLVLEQPSQHTKSSPVPIKRHTSIPSTSPRQSMSPHQRGSMESSNDTYYYSPSSGPPSLHPVGSGSPYRYQGQTLHRSDVTDQGFIIVDMPGQRRYSSSPHSAPSLSPASFSSVSRTPSSCGSLTRYTSLTTPFYQAPLKSAGEHVQFPGSSPSLSHSNSLKRRTSEPFANTLSHTPPFGKLIQHPQTSPSSSPRSSSSLFTRQKSNTSPSTPPSSLPLSIPMATNISSGNRPYSYGMRYAVTSHGSGTKLSSLAETTEPRASTQAQARHRSNSGPKLPTCEDFFTHSQILNSDDEDFPLNLSMTSSNKTDEHSGGESDILSFAQEYVKYKAPRERENRPPRRASSFSQRRTNPRLCRDLEAIRARSASLQDPDYTPTPTNKDLHYTFDDMSPTSAIVPFKLPFLFSSSETSQSSSRPNSLGQLRTLDSAYESGKVTGRRSLSEESQTPLAILSQAMFLTQELLDMVKIRQGPIMLLSTDLNDSGIVGQVQRFSEQLVLCAKALSVLGSGRRQYEIALATSNMESTESLKTVESRARQLYETCVERARNVKELLQQYNKERGKAQYVRVSAERILCLEALDLCKTAVLGEQSGNPKECIKKYRRAKLIFQQLLSDATTERDRSLMQKYVHSIQKRIQHLSER